MWYTTIFSTLILAVLSTANPSCPPLKSGFTNVHLICHTHDDVGWLKTVDQYYYGARKDITWVGVQYILDSVVASLLKDKSRKFIYVESAFFFRWWHEQDDGIKNIVKKLVSDGQLEFINGGWCMNDEAAAHYTAIVDQMTVGLVMLNDTFGSSGRPRVAWQIDPFGHSREQASLFAQMGFDGLFFGRLDHADKSKRQARKEMEMVWKGSQSLGRESWLFTGVLPNNYSPPSGFCFDLLCKDQPIMDDPNLEDNNVDYMVDNFLQAVKNQQVEYATSNLIMTMGEDFNYVNAESWYKNLDKLIKYVNRLQSNGSLVNLVYSTPSCYMDALHSTKTSWPTKEDDFFPYSSDIHSYWTGYFTSRPTLKGFIRQSNGLLQAAKQFSALSGVGRNPSLERLSLAMAVAQHHDAVTGTAKQHVTFDYDKRLSEGQDAVYNMIGDQLSLTDESVFGSCPLLNISSCPITEESSSFEVVIYNSISRERIHIARVPVRAQSAYKVIDGDGHAVESQLIPIPASVLGIPGRHYGAYYELLFKATLPPLGSQRFYVTKSSNTQYAKKQMSTKTILDNRIEDTVVKKGDLSITLDGRTNMLKSIRANNKDIKIHQTWVWYAGVRGNNGAPAARASGAYIFRPNSTEAFQFTDAPLNNCTVYDGPLLAEVRQEWTSYVTQVLRLYKYSRYVEIEWLVGPIPIGDQVGKEIVNRFTLADMKTEDFYTDSNGRELLKRVLNYRPTWELYSTETVSQNYYPVTSRIVLKSVDKDEEAAILNDRAQGGTSLSSGQMDLMVHRRLLDDDGFGVGEALNEEAFNHGLVARGKHLFIHSAFKTPECSFACLHRSTSESLLMSPLMMFRENHSTMLEWKRSQSDKKSGLSQPLPAAIHLMTLEPWIHKEQWLLRLENMYEKGELDQPSVTVDIENMFSEWNVVAMREVTLSANQWLDEATRMEWKTKETPKKEKKVKKGNYRMINSLLRTKIGRKEDKWIKQNEEISDGVFSFYPMQIRSFVLTVEKKKE